MKTVEPATGAVRNVADVPIRKGKNNHDRFSLSAGNDLPEAETERIYTYTIEQIAGLNPLCAYDPSVYHLKVSVTNAQDGSGLTAMVALRSEEADEKLAEAMFTNRYGTSPVPRDSNPPKTGDESNILLYGYLALVSIAGLVVSVVIQKRGKRRSS